MAIKVKNDGDKFIEPITKAANQAKQLVTDRFEEGFNQIKDKYTTVGKEAWEKIKAGQKQQQTQLETIKDSAKKYAGTVNSQKEDINYYAFTAGYLVKGLLKKLPIVAMDSAMEAYWGENGNGFLSGQKFAKIFGSNKFPTALAAVVSAIKTKQTTIENMTSQDAEGFWKVIRDTQGNSIDKWLEQIQTNASSLDQNYCNATKLLLHLMVGKSSLNELKTKIENLKTQVEQMKALLAKIDGLGDQLIANLESKLGTLKDQQNLGDPCPSDD